MVMFLVRKIASCRHQGTVVIARPVFISFSRTSFMSSGVWSVNTVVIP